MNESVIREWKPEFEGKNILVWGYGREGKASASLIHALCPDLVFTIADAPKAEKLLEQAKYDYPSCIVKADNAVDFSSFDMILKSPGIVLPEGFDTKNITGETQLFLKHYAKQTIGVTGTKGKSTTTTLVYKALSEKYRTHLVGNIGRACFEAVPDMEGNDLVAFEISCHQLEYSPYSPHTAVFLNLYEEHLDHYGSFAKYGAAKANIFRHQKEGDVCIINQELTQYIPEIHDPLLIGRDIRNEGRTLIIPGKRLEVKDCALIGEHNYLNLAVVYYIAGLYGISDDQFLHMCSTFEPLHHRLEDLGEFHGIRYVNDSISTIGQSCIKALEALQDVDTVLIGGMDRGIEYHELEDYLAQHKELNVIFMYASGKRVAEELRETERYTENTHIVDDLGEAVNLAKKLTRPHHICLLSPAASSYDHFKNFEERGEVFGRMVRE